MKQFFKTTLLATAVALTCGTAVAGTVAVTKQVHSTEGLEGVTASQESGTITYTLGAAYREGDKITFTFPENSLVANGFPSQINMSAVDSDTAASALAGAALGLLNSTANTVTYRVTSVTQPRTVTNPVAYTDRTTLGNILTLGAVKYTAAAIKAASVTVAVDSQTTAGDVLDSGGTRTATVAESKTQFGTATINDKFDAVIDVAQMRRAFVSGSTDAMTYTLTNPTTTGWLNLATVNSSNGTLVTLQGEAGKMTGVKVGNWSSSGARTFTESEAKLVVSYGGISTNDTITFTPPTGNDAIVLETQDFSTKFEYNYTSAGSQAGSKLVVGALDSGSWTLNGATVNIPYMPYGVSASQIMYVSNAGSQDGDISVTVFDDKGAYYDLGVIGTAGKQRVTKLATLISAKLAEAGFAGTKASITVTVNAPAADITVFSSYNVGGSDRGFVNTDQYKGQ